MTLPTTSHMLAMYRRLAAEHRATAIELFRVGCSATGYVFWNWHIGYLRMVEHLEGERC